VLRRGSSGRWGSHSDAGGYWPNDHRVFAGEHGVCCWDAWGSSASGVLRIEQVGDTEADVP